MTYSATTEPGYVLPNSWEHASERLELLEACYDAASFWQAAALGVRSGWRCLDAGAGHGSFARWLGSTVGASGSVVAADLDTRLLQDITEPNARFVSWTWRLTRCRAGSSTSCTPAWC